MMPTPTSALFPQQGFTALRTGVIVWSVTHGSPPAVGICGGSCSLGSGKQVCVRATCWPFTMTCLVTCSFLRVLTLPTRWMRLRLIVYRQGVDAYGEAGVFRFHLLYGLL